MEQNVNRRNTEYMEYVNAKEPKTTEWPSLIFAFLIGGTICLIGEVISNFLQMIWPTLSSMHALVWTQIIIMAIAILLTGIGVFDDIAKIAGAGTIIPITGFANSIASSALEFKREGIIQGVCVKMFIVAGPVVVSAIVSSVILGIIYLFIYQL